MLDLYDAKSDHDEGIPAGLDEMEPGPILAAFLSSIDVTRVSGYDRIVVLRAHQRLVSHYTASLYADMAAVVDVLDDDDTKRCDAAEAAAAEVRAALHLTRRCADTEVGIALELHTRLPQIHDMLASGDLDLRRARVLLDGTAHLDDAAARRVIDQIADDATRYTTGQLRTRLRTLCIEAEPDDAALRYRRRRRRTQSCGRTERHRDRELPRHGPPTRPGDRRSATHQPHRPIPPPQR